MFLYFKMNPGSQTLTKLRSRLGLYHTQPYHPPSVVSKVRLGLVLVKQGNPAMHCNEVYILNKLMLINYRSFLEQLLGFKNFQSWCMVGLGVHKLCQQPKGGGRDWKMLTIAEKGGAVLKIITILLPNYMTVLRLEGLTIKGLKLKILNTTSLIEQGLPYKQHCH